MKEKAFSSNFNHVALMIKDLTKHVIAAYTGEIKKECLKCITEDIQGAEGHALAGMEQTLRGNDDIVILFEFWPYGLRRASTTPEHVLENLAAEFRAGTAQVNPKHPGKTCNYCELKPVCRIHEMNALHDDGDEDGR